MRESVQSSDQRHPAQDGETGESGNEVGGDPVRHPRTPGTQGWWRTAVAALPRRPIRREPRLSGVSSD